MRDIRDRLPAPGSASLTAADRFGRLFAAIHANMDGLDLPFESAEVLDAARLDDRLAALADNLVRG